MSGEKAPPYPAGQGSPYPECGSDAVAGVIGIYRMAITGNLCHDTDHLISADARLGQKLIVAPHRAAGIAHPDDPVEDECSVVPLIEDNLILFQTVRKRAEDDHITLREDEGFHARAAGIEGEGSSFFEDLADDRFIFF